VLIQETLAVKKLFDSVCITILFTLGTTEKISALAPPHPTPVTLLSITFFLLKILVCI
jgi:hypothetical protein